MKHVLIISGLDPSGGAGFIADSRVVTEHDLRPVGVVSALTVQDTSGVRAIELANAEIVDDQLHALLTDVEVSAIKIGMLGDERVCRVLCDALQLTNAPTVWDPIVRPTRGGVALYQGDVAGAASLLAEHLTLMTPNLAEAELLTGMTLDSVSAMTVCAQRLQELMSAAVLITGGHLDGDECVDVLAADTGVHEFSGARVSDAHNVHGTGCALSTAVACNLAHGQDLQSAIGAAKQYVATKLANPARPGRGSPSVL